MKRTVFLFAVFALVALSQVAFAEAPQSVTPDETAGALQSTEPPPEVQEPVRLEELFLPAAPAEDGAALPVPAPRPAGGCFGGRCAVHVCECNFECSGCYAVITCYPDYLCVCC